MTWPLPLVLAAPVLHSVPSELVPAQSHQEMEQPSSYSRGGQHSRHFCVKDLQTRIELLGFCKEVWQAIFISSVNFQKILPSCVTSVKDQWIYSQCALTWNWNSSKHLIVTQCLKKRWGGGSDGRVKKTKTKAVLYSVLQARLTKELQVQRQTELLFRMKKKKGEPGKGVGRKKP